MTPSTGPQPFSVALQYGGKSFRLDGKTAVLAVMLLANRQAINLIVAGGVRFDWGVGGRVNINLNSAGKPLDEISSAAELAGARSG